MEKKTKTRLARKQVMMILTMTKIKGDSSVKVKTWAQSKLTKMMLRKMRKPMLLAFKCLESVDAPRRKPSLKRRS